MQPTRQPPSLTGRGRTGCGVATDFDGAVRWSRTSNDTVGLSLIPTTRFTGAERNRNTAYYGESEKPDVLFHWNGS